MFMVAMSARARRIPVNISRDSPSDGGVGPPDPAPEFLVHGLLGHPERVGDLRPGPSLVDGRLHAGEFESVGQSAQRHDLTSQCFGRVG